MPSSSSSVQTESLLREGMTYIMIKGTELIEEPSIMCCVQIDSSKFIRDPHGQLLPVEHLLLVSEAASHCMGQREGKKKIRIDKCKSNGGVFLREGTNPGLKSTEGGKAGNLFEIPSNLEHMESEGKLHSHVLEISPSYLLLLQNLLICEHL